MYIIVNIKNFETHGEFFTSLEEAFEYLRKTYGLDSGYTIFKKIEIVFSFKEN